MATRQDDSAADTGRLQTGAANEINNRGEVVGITENSTPDADRPAPQVVRFKPVVCKEDRIQELRTFAGSLGGIAFGINENGPVVGHGNSTDKTTHGIQLNGSNSH